MKTISAILVALWVSTCWTNAQTASSPLPVPDTTGQTVPSDGRYVVSERGPDYRVWQKIIQTVDEQGNLTSQAKPAYIELTTGMHYQNNGQWMESKEEIQILPNGTAVAIQGQHQAYFPGNIYQGMIKLVTPDGKLFISRPLGLSYFDGTNSVLIAELKDSVGELVGSNQVIYFDAFTDFRADLCYTYAKSGFEQEIILREQPPVPEGYGMALEKTRLQVLTEFFNPPQPAKKNTLLREHMGVRLNDEALDFGVMKIGSGKAFAFGDQPDSGDSVAVAKSWLLLDGRQFLVEELPVAAIAEQLDGLPVTAQASLKPAGNSVRHVVSTKRLLPALRMAQANGTNQIKSAKLDISRRGFVLDYITVNSSLTNYTFQGDTTYYISGPVVLFGTNTFEGGTVLKYAPTNSSSVICSGTINSPSSAYRPAIFTARDDNSVGETISGSSGNPTGYYASNALCLNGGTSVTLQNLRFSFARTALALSGSGSNVFSHVQMIKCQNGINAINARFSLRNALLWNVLTNFGGSGSTGAVEQLTVDTASRLNNNLTLSLTNCLLVAVTNTGAFTSNSVSITNKSTGVFLVAGAGAHYLATNSPYRNAGTTNLNPALLSALRKMTTYPPMLLTNQTVSTNTTLNPQAPRDTDTPDRGYHYDPIDYLVDNFAITNATLTVTNGTAIASYNETGVQLLDGSAIVSIGSPLYPNWFVRYSSVQEQAILLGGTNLASGLTVSALHYGNMGPTGRFRFSKFACPAGGGYLFNDTGASAYSSLRVQDCELWSGPNVFSGNTNTVTTLQNNLFYRSSFGAYPTATVPTSLSFSNNLIFGTTVFFFNQATPNTWQAFNNAYDSSIISTNQYVSRIGSLTNGYNAYLNCTNRLMPLGAFDIVTNATLAYQTGPLGAFYQPTNSPLINKGSTNANLVGLYHYTVTTNEVVEGTDTVSIGYHYVATDAYGNPLDTDGDGIPDYLEDANGNGLVDNGETPWGIAILTQPQSQTVIQGSNATFSVTMSTNSTPPLSYQWYFNVTNLLVAATNTSLTITNAQWTNAGNYTVVVTNTVGSVTSMIATLTLQTDPDLPGAPANFELIPAGSLVIPMDTNYQALVTGNPFNMKAYGLVNALLHANIPVKWAIASGKAKDGIDFSANVSRILPTNNTASILSFRCGPFIVLQSFTNQAWAVMTNFGSSVAVYRLTSNTTVDVHYTVAHKPQVAVLNDGGKQSIHTDILAEAGFPATSYTVLNSADTQFLAGASCYTIVTSPHNDGGTTATNQTHSIRTFILDGGNFLAQCAAVRTYENDTVYGHFQSTLGFDDANSDSFSYPNADMAFNQFQGDLLNEQGSLHDWKLASGSVLTNNAYAEVLKATTTNIFRAGVAKLIRGKPGSVVFYLGGHEYPSTKVLGDYNGRRMFLNALFVPPDRPGDCVINFQTDLGITQTDGVSVVTNGQPVTYTIVVTNYGPGRVVGATVTNLFAASLTGVSWTSAVTGVATNLNPAGNGDINATVNIPVFGSVIFTVQATVNAGNFSAVTNTATVTVPAGMSDSDSSNNTATDVDQIQRPPQPPVISQQPTNQTVNPGGTATFSVTVSTNSTTPLSYQWYFNGTNVLTNATSATLTLTNVQSGQAGNYTVVVANVAGSVTSSNAVLTVNVPPAIAQQPANVTTNAGGGATFNVVATGTSPLYYQWRKNGSNLTNGGNVSGANSSTLTLTNVSPWDAGIYTVGVTNVAGSVNSSYAVLRVWTPSGVVAWGADWYGQTDVPIDLTNAVAIAAGYFHSLALKGNGTVVGWGYDDDGETDVPSDLMNVVAIAGDEYHSLALRNDGTVVAWGADWYGQTDIPSGLTNGVAVAGGNYHSLALKGDGTVVAWGDNTYGQTNVPFGLTNVVAIAGGGSHSLALESDGTVVAWGADWYGQTDVPPGLTNVVAIAAGDSHSLALGHLLPAITTQPANQTLLQGSTAIFIVMATGSWPLSYQWSCNGTNINGATNTVLTLTNIQLSQSGNYAVLVTNVFGSVLSSNAVLTVIQPTPCIYPPTGLVAWWRAENNANDSKGTNNGTLVNGVTFTNGMVGQGFHLNGTNQYVQIADSADLKPISVTVEAWVRLDTEVTPGANSPGQQVIVFKKNTRAGYFEGYVLLKNRENGRDFFSFGVTSSGGYQVSVNSTTIAQVGIWYHLVGTYDGGTGYLKIYVNGVPEASTYAGFPLDYGTRPIFIGTTGEYWDGRLGGAVDEVSIYNRALTTNEIQSLYYTGPNGKCTVNNPALTVQITSPTNSQFFVTSPLNISLAATTSDSGGTVTNVQFFNGTNLLGSGASTSSNAWTLLWWDVTNGNYSLTAKAFDDVGHTATNNVSITVNAMPVVSIVTPTNFQSFLQTNSVTLSASASDPDGLIAQVQFYYFTNLWGTFTGPGTNGLYNFTTNNLPPGFYPITAVATDNRGAVGWSDIVIFRVNSTNPPPTTAITFPTNNSVFAPGSDITITATATNFPASVTNVEFFVNGESIGVDADAPYEVAKCCWKPGTYVLVAKATDDRGATAISTPVTNAIVQEVPATEGFWDLAFGVLGDPDWYGLMGEEFGFTSVAIGTNGNIYVAGYGPAQGIYPPMVCVGSTNWQFMGNPAAGDEEIGWSGIIVDATNVYAGGAAGINYGTTTAVTWDGSSWKLLGNHLGSGNAGSAGNNIIFAKVGGDIYAGGEFTYSGDGSSQDPMDTNVQRIAKLDITSHRWVSVGNGITNGGVYAITAIQNVLYIGGSFTHAGGNTNANYVARLENGSWTNLGSGISSIHDTNGEIPYDVKALTIIYGKTAIWALAACDSNLFVGGSFTIAGGNTNANGIALWNGREWQTIGNGVGIYPFTLRYFSVTNTYVTSIATRGNRIFVGGGFTNVFNDGGQIVPANNIATAIWSEEAQTWTWSDLDQGMIGMNWDGPDVTFGAVEALAIGEGDIPTRYDLYVAGDFRFAGSDQMLNTGVARWRVGYPQPPARPRVSITSPRASTIFTNPTAPLYLRGLAFSGSTNIQSANFYTNGVVVGSPQTPCYDDTNYFLFTNEWDNPLPGVYLIKAMAKDDNQITGESKPVVVSIKDTNNSVMAVDDQYTIPSGTPAVTLDVLANDSPAKGLKISQIIMTCNNLGRVTISHDGTYLTYTPLPYVYGTDIFYYSITNASNAVDSASVTVTVHPRPFVEILEPGGAEPGGVAQVATSSNGVTSLVVSGDSYESGGSVTNVDLYVNGVRFGSTNHSDFSFNWSTNANGIYTFVAVVADGDGYTNASSPVTILTYSFTNEVTAAIYNLGVPAASIASGLSLTGYPVVSNGLFDLQGQARATTSSTNVPVAYQIMLCQPDGYDTPIANVTPQQDSGGLHEGGDVNGDLGILDFSGVPNGVYDLELTVFGGGSQTNVTVRFILGSQLKLGQFSFSEQDLVLPVNGLPITITRTYNSQNPLSSDFGYSWSFAINSMDVQLDEIRENVMPANTALVWYDEDEDDYRVATPVSMRMGGDLDVTLTLPNGQRATFAFTPESLGMHAEAKWTAPPWIHATLEPLNANDAIIDYYPAPVHWRTGGENSDYEHHDMPGWMLITLPDNTKYQITRGQVKNAVYDPNSDGKFVNVQVYGPPKLTSIIQRSGDLITINGNGISHYANYTNLTRSITFTRDLQGRITAIYDPISQLSISNPPPGQSGATAGQPAVKYVYNRNTGNLMWVLKLVDRAAGTYTTNKYRYDNLAFPHFITSIENGDGVPVARNYYDDSGKLIAVQDANGNLTQFIHNTTNNMEIIVDQLSYGSTNYYDPRGNVTATVNALGQTNRFAFDDNNYLLSSVDPLGHTYTYTYDSYGNPTSVVDPLGHTNLTAYNGYGQPIAMTNALNFVTRFQYDSRGNQTNTVDALNNHYGVAYDANSKPTAVTDPFNRTNATATYDSMGNLASLTDKSSGATTTFAYDANGNQTASTNLWVNPTNSSDTRVVASHSVYDAQGRVISSTDPNGLQSSVTYDAVGRQSQLVDEYNRTSGWAYDARGSLVQISFPDGSISRMVYDNAGRMSVTDDKHLPGNIANGTRTTYDAVGQVIKSERLTNVVIDISTGGGISSSAVTSIGGVISTSTYGYDLAGRQIAVTNGFASVTRYEYDAAGQQTAVIDALTNRTDNMYDPAGHLIFTTNALHQVTQYVYDALGHSVRTIYPDGSFTAVGYDAVGNRLVETNQLDLVTTYQYDSASRMTNILKPAVFDPETSSTVNPAWGFVYDANGQLQSVSNPKRRQTSFTYDQFGRPVTRTLPLGQTASQVYDAFGRTFRKIDFKGQTNEFLYDSTGRLGTNRFYAAGSSVATNTVTYAYDSEDRTKQIVEPRGTNAFTYDNQGHLMQIASPEGAVNYEYEPIEGRRVRTYTSNSDLRYTYDELGRVKTVAVVKRDGATLSPWEVTTNTYTALGSLQNVYFPNGARTFYQYDLMNRVTNVVNYNGTNGILARYQYTLGTNGVVKAITEVRLESNATYTTNQITYTYDNLGRLVREASVSPLSEANYTNSYVYSLVGNLLWRTNGATGEVITYSYNTNDQLLVESSTLSSSFTNKYDINGSLTNRASASESAAYVYDLQNRLSGATINRVESGHTVAITASYTNNYMGRRVRSIAAKSIDGAGATNQTRIFLLDTKSGNAQVLEELSAVGGTPTMSYTIGNKVLSQSKGGVVSHLLSDGHSSTRLLTDSAAAITAWYSYDAYGKTLGYNPGTLNPPATAMLYSGEQLDADLQQYYLQARYYNPTVGRFNQIDPFGPNQRSGMNLYAYCGNDPINNIDPTGKSFFAFDGTGNWEGEIDKGVWSPTNVRKMYQASGDQNRYYLRGIGNEADFSGLDANSRQAYGYGFADILDDAWNKLITYRQNGDNVVDIVGFSRGGIEATEFANRIADAFPDERIRFVGLYDPVGSVRQPGWFGGYRFTLPANVEHAAEAMALDEDRSMFPATNVRGAVQQWFRGTHSDVGGGWANHRLSDVSLQWMAQQASSAGVSLDLGRVRPEITNPPQPNAPINKNSGFTSWFTTPGGRTVIRPLTVDDVNGYIEASAFGSAYFGL